MDDEHDITKAWERGGQPEWDNNDYTRDFTYWGINRAEYANMKVKVRQNMTVPPLMDRAARRRLLFAPIAVHRFGGHSWGGHTTIDEGDNTRKGSSNSEYVAEFRRRSRLNEEDE